MKILSFKREFSVGEEGISETKTIIIGGIPQTILIQTANRHNPVLLFLHGGPSMPLPGVCCRSQEYTGVLTTKELVKHFTVVFWDQRGTGKSYRSDTPASSFHVRQFIEDTNELIDYLRNTFQQEKIVLAAHSWGTVLGLHLAYEKPEKLYAYIGVSQIINWAENDRLCREWALKEAYRRNNKKAIQELEGVGEPPYLESFEQWGTLRRWLLRFNSMIYTDTTVKHPGMAGMAKIMLRSPDYSLGDIVNSLYRGFKLSYTQRMIEDLSGINFFKEDAKLEIPVYFIHGKKDVHVNGKLVEEYLNKVEAPNGMQLHWVEKSSHLFHPDDARIIEQLIIQKAEIFKDQAIPDAEKTPV
ncbi:alpha/beta fold hydrolase [Pseudalkalibacillus caeni]|uniref:Alpha/beta hydrolase n=1 Tax=Exobacillus caeni TaxID=2574798 RepID=A0A5R9F5F3_9BACL|nr:alpha/beta hydrolase [Pseudalkalibacillus caeni]TLS35035.1 alpha/beta hydrolase [Pseudalkalibacillus caeni]